VLPHACPSQRIAAHLRKIHFSPVLPCASLPHFAGFEDLLDCPQQPVGVFLHDVVKHAALGFIQRTAFQGLQIKSNRSNRSFQFVSDSVQKTILLFVPPDFAHQKNRVDHHSRDQQSKKNNAKHQRHHLPPVKNNPTDVERNR